MRFNRLGLVFAMCLSRQALAQKTLVSVTGAVFRYAGDTIWMERDTNLTRIVFHGDTITKTMTLNDRRRATMVYVVRGDSARLIERRDSADRALPMMSFGPSVPAAVVNYERRGLEMELRLQESRQRMAAMRSFADPMQPPALPDTTMSYAVSSAVRITQHRDTVRYIYGCTALGRVDTTTFLLFGADSVRRLSSPARTFGPAMANSLIGHMRLALGQRFMEGQHPGAGNDLPNVPDPCAKGK